MGCTPEAIKAFQDAKLPFAPGKAVNAGGVATSGLEMTQNAAHLSWTSEEVDAKLHQIMESIHNACLKYGQEDGLHQLCKRSQHRWIHESSPCDARPRGHIIVFC